MREPARGSVRVRTLSVQLHLLIDPMYVLQVHQLAAAMKDLGTDLTLRVSNMSHEFSEAICRILLEKICCFLLIWRMMLLPYCIEWFHIIFYIFEQEAEKLIQTMDTSGVGLIQFWEFVEFFKPKVDHAEEVELGGMHEDAGGDAAKKNQAQLEAEFEGINHVAILADQIVNKEKKIYKIEDKIEAQRKIIRAGISSKKVVRLLEEMKREWLECRDKIDTMKAEVEKVKKKYAKKVPQTNDKKIVLYKSIDSDLNLGLEMADEVQSRMRLCQKLMRELRELKVQEQAMLLDLWTKPGTDTVAALKQLQREMADVMAELRTRAGELESQYEQVANGAKTVQWYWYKERQTDLFFARNDLELYTRREREGFLADFAIKQGNVSQTLKH